MTNPIDMIAYQNIKIGKEVKMIGNLEKKLPKDESGKFLIFEDTPNKQQNRFYRQENGNIYFDIESGGDLLESLDVCLKVSKQEQCKVNFVSNVAGITTLTPDMNQTDAVNQFICHKFLKTAHYSDTKDKIDKIRAQQQAPKNIDFGDFYYNESGPEKVISFCKANDIDILALKMHYDLVHTYAKLQEGTYEEQVVKATEHYKIPAVITQENLPQLRQKLVLSRDDERVRAIAVNISKQDYQR